MTKGILCLAGASFAANAAVSPDRTRIIYNQSDKSVSVRLTNQSPDTPFLAQSWIEDKDNKNLVLISPQYRQCCALKPASRRRCA
jgi:P pilus assembly chaperone PapD